ncbi:hypothetical protein [Nostoc sp. WHI]|uniref:hypothetical protein n=1 Tax=Nostoc sp. WHI TaxID=2650611 RepID=UPI0018C51644|nr:hypothetical protein [Nostoc sp. WHI]
MLLTPLRCFTWQPHLMFKASSRKEFEFTMQQAQDFLKNTKNTQDSKDGKGSAANRG